MTTTIISGLILLSLALCYTIAQLYHRLRLSNKENEKLIKEHAESESGLRKEISDLKNENSKLYNENSESKKERLQEISSIKDKHAKEISSFKKNINTKIPETPRYSFQEDDDIS